MSGESGSRPNPARVVADADVLAADLLVGGSAREALDLVRAHSWMELIASDALLADARDVIERCSDPALAKAWRERIERERVAVTHPAGDHPALASAYRGAAAHLLSLDEELRRARTGTQLRARVRVSVKTPEGFVRQWDAESLYSVVENDNYPGPDRDSRA